MEQYEITFGQEWRYKDDDVTWRVVGIKPDMITLTGPGICRSVKCVTPDELHRTWHLNIVGKL